MMNFYIHAGGGVGDIIKNYFWGTKGWGYLKNIKRQNSKVKLLLASSNPAAEDLFAGNKFIDEIESYPWQRPGSKFKRAEELNKQGYINLSIVGRHVKKLKFEKPKFMYFTEADKELYKKIKPAGKYTVIHPFIARMGLQPIETSEFREIALRIRDKTQLPVLILGGTHNRTAFIAEPGICTEEYGYEDEGIINLVNKTNLRIAVNLTQNATSFVGTNSCFYCVRLGLGQPAAIIDLTQIKESVISEDGKSCWIGAKSSKNKESIIDLTVKTAISSM